jgi:EAL domain-containing protein (putative c-di-GMP-specific phosphodiesterase class I)
MLGLDDILIVDDSQLHRMHAAGLCAEAKQLRQAQDGEEGLAMMREHLPQLVLLDLEMPRLDGVQVLQHMAAEGLRVPVIVTSGKDYMLISSVEMMGRELGLPVLGGLKKPLRQQDLLDLLKRLDGSSGPGQHAAEQFSESAIRHALDQRQIVPFYQPKVTLKGGLLKGAEILARWEHPELGIIPPNQFIPTMERCGWTTELTLLMFEAGLQQWQKWAQRGLRIPLSVNLSALSLHGNALIAEIEERLKISQVPARYTIFEITETAVADNLAEAIGIAAHLRLCGFGLSIDDFGTGFATLQQLTRFPFTELKIDQSLVTSVADKPHMEAILNSVIELAKRLQLTTVAEGIETSADQHFIAGHGCLLGQGYLFSRPLGAVQFEAWVKSRLHHQSA